MSKSRRLELHDKLVDVMGTRGEEKTRVYFQPPPTVQMEYPCIIYNRVTNNVIFSDDNPHRIYTAYLVSVVDPNPDSDIPDKVAKLPLCRFDRFYTQDNLNHDVFTVYH